MTPCPPGLARPRVGSHVRPASDPANAAAPPAPPSSGRPCARSSRRSDGDAPRRPRHRRRHRRLRGPGRRARPPGHGGRPQPRRPGRARPPGPRERGRRPGHRPAGRPVHLLDVAGPRSVDVVLCHGVLEVVDDPAAALATIAEVLRPGGTLSLLVAQRHAAVVARAMAGHFQQARGPPRRLRPRRPGPGAGSPPTRSPTLLAGAGFDDRGRCTASGSSPTWCPARCSTSSPVPPQALRRARAGGRRAPRVPPPRDPAARARPALRLPRSRLARRGGSACPADGAWSSPVRIGVTTSR